MKRVVCVLQKVRQLLAKSAGAGETAQVLAPCECFRIDGNNRVGDDNAGQAGAAGERLPADGCNRVGNGNAGQAGAIRERRHLDGRDGIGNGDVFQTTTM